MPTVQRDALEAAAQPRAQLPRAHRRRPAARAGATAIEDGTLLGQKVTPLDRVGIYVPGGKAAYPSSVLMNAIPAHVAGVRKSSWWCPRRAARKTRWCWPPPTWPASPRLHHRRRAGRGRAGLRHRHHPAVDKITGPGNAYVASAKSASSATVGIDMIAGPSEILVLADGSTPADWVAMDLFSQAEHDELAQSILLCPDAAYIAAVQASINRLLPEMPRAAIIAKSLNGRGALIHTREHGRGLRDQQPHRARAPGGISSDPHRWEPLLKHAGAIFLGAYTSESLGDYCAGPNHVLPTSGTARFSSARWGCTTSRSAAA
jgi:histidinol dehydrogenase